VTVREAARALDVSSERIYRLMNSGRLQSQKIGQRRFVWRRALLELMETGTCRGELLG
jgi:excisionase family DNA binding protein